MALGLEPYIHLGNNNLIDIENRSGLRELAGMVQRLFHVPVSYIALVEKGPAVFTRIGFGEKFWNFLKTYPLRLLLNSPVAVRDSADGLPEGTDFGPLRFAASAPLHTADGLLLGLLIIADAWPRPQFGAADLQAFGKLGRVLANTMELSMLTSDAICAQLADGEPDTLSRSLLDVSPALLLRIDAHGHCSYFGERWAMFLGAGADGSSSDGWLQAVHAEDRERCSLASREAMETGEPLHLVCRFRSLEGRDVPMLMKGASEFGPESTLEQFVIAGLELTGVSTESLLAVLKL